jgi:hypothetical protein
MPPCCIILTYHCHPLFYGSYISIRTSPVSNICIHPPLSHLYIIYSCTVASFVPMLLFEWGYHPMIRSSKLKV